MKTKVKALTSFMHGRVHAHAGDELEVTKGEADELVSAGLVALEGAKAEGAPLNKMEGAPANKGGADHDDLVGMPEHRGEDIPLRAEGDNADEAEQPAPAEEPTEATEPKPAARKTAPKKAD